jgi:hypothetical protein
MLAFGAPMLYSFLGVKKKHILGLHFVVKLGFDIETTFQP